MGLVRVRKDKDRSHPQETHKVKERTTPRRQQNKVDINPDRHYVKQETTSVKLTSIYSHRLLHLYSPENEEEDQLIQGEINVFKLEHPGSQNIHSIHRFSSAEAMLVKLTHSIQEACNDSLTVFTIVIWGHGNRWSESTGYLKIFTGSQTVFLLLDDLIKHMINQILSHNNLTIQLLMTQCWAHCHDKSLYSNSPQLLVEYLTNHDEPETSARRWDLFKTGGYMTQEEFEKYLYSENHYAELEELTVKSYTDTEKTILLKYLNYGSIHIEATCFLHLQNDMRC